METFKKHIVHLAKGGMGPVVAGSMGEAFSLADDERIALFKAAREALDEANLESSLICGTYVFLIMTSRALLEIGATGNPHLHLTKRSCFAGDDTSPICRCNSTGVDETENAHTD